MKSISTVPLHRPVILHLDDTLKQAAFAMQNNNVGSVLVLDQSGELNGIITDRDLAICMAVEEIDANEKLSRVARPSLITVSQFAPISEVVSTMREYAIRRVPVVKEESGGHRRCVGVVTLDDLIKSGLIDSDDTREIVKNQTDQIREGETGENRDRTKYLFREQDQRRHTYHTFIHRVAEAAQISRGDARNLTIYVLGSFLRRITVEEGKDLLSQLPYLLQAELMSDISQVDRSIKTEDIVRHLSERMNRPEAETKDLLRKFWRLMSELISPQEVEEVCSQMPRDMQAILR